MSAVAPRASGAVAVAGAEDEVPRFAAAFTAGTLPKEQWTHRAHLLVALWHGATQPADEALDAMRAGILRLNAVHGVVTTPSRGYHETITRAYMRLVMRFVRDEPPGSSWSSRAARLLARHGEREHLLRHYTRDRLFSSEARFGWVEPDLLPLP
ncbi:MAG TPA: hypothetical protein VEB59_14940 [Gemmatimonadales bacterium]|nr:hypothetical protein [Gemmatimonadales bacterium]